MRFNKLIFAIVLILLSIPTFSFSSQAHIAIPPDPIFSVHLLCPTNNANRTQFAQLMEAEFPKIGIDAQLDFISWSNFVGNVTQIVGPYDKGGYDILFSGGALNEDSLGSSLMSYFHEVGLPPNGFNLMYWAEDPQYMSYRAAESNALIEAIAQETDQDTVKSMSIEWQKLWYDAMPNVLAYNENDNTSWQAMWFNPKYVNATQLSATDHPLNRKGVRHAISHIVPRENIVTNILSGSGLPAYTPMPVNSWAAIPEDDMITFRKTVTASDGSKPEVNATTAYDEYSLDLAMYWLASEGYDMTPWGGHAPYPGAVVITSPSTVTSSTDEITVNLTGDAVHYWYYIAGVDTVNQTWIPPVSRNLADGTYILHAYGNDSTGNEWHVSVTFIIDLPPIITIVSPSNTTYTTSTISLDFTGDAVYHWYFIEGIDTNNHTWTPETQRSLTDGTYVLHAYVNDSTGNEAHANVTFTIDTTTVSTTSSTTVTTTSSTTVTTSSSTTATTPVTTPSCNVPLLLLSFSVILLIKKRRKKS
ncbi:MAG: ABC transporter substrate-binding protein [Candidatus Hodarchaeales archaeon]